MAKDRAELDARRKRLFAVEKNIGKLVTEQRELQNEIYEYEKTCHHQWGKREYNKKNDRFTRVCDLCGKENISKE
jgi:hypothetical protein